MSTATALLQELEWLRQNGQSQSNVVGISGLVKFLYTIPVTTIFFISYFLKPFLIQDLLILPCTLSPHLLLVMVREFKFCFSSYDYPGTHLLCFTYCICMFQALILSRKSDQSMGSHRGIGDRIQISET